MNQPTKEQIQWLWEQCGWRDYYPLGFRNGWADPEGNFHSELPPIDLNNLFWYAVPKFTHYDIWCATRWGEATKSVVPDYHCAKVVLGWYDREYRVKVEKGDTPALALFWAIYKAFGGKE